MGYRKLLRERAEEIFDQFEKALSSALPHGFHLSRANCRLTIESLIEKGIKSDELLKEFMGMLLSEPLRFCYADQETVDLMNKARKQAEYNSLLQSGAPRSMGRSEVRR